MVFCNGDFSNYQIMIYIDIPILTIVINHQIMVINHHILQTKPWSSLKSGRKRVKASSKSSTFFSNHANATSKMLFGTILYT